MSRRLWIALALAASLGAPGCQCLPERFAVNAPILHMTLGHGTEAPPPDAVSQRFQAPPGQRVSLYARDLPVIPLYWRANAYVLPKWLEGVRPTGHQGTTTLWVEEWRDAR